MSIENTVVLPQFDEESIRVHEKYLGIIKAILDGDAGMASVKVEINIGNVIRKMKPLPSERGGEYGDTGVRKISFAIEYTDTKVVKNYRKQLHNRQKERSKVAQASM